jgi:hypothetical protein
LDVVQVIVNLQMVRVVRVECLPFVCHLIERIRRQVRRHWLEGTIRTHQGLNVLHRGLQLTY